MDNKENDGKKDTMEEATEWSANTVLTHTANEVRHAPKLVQSVQTSEYLQGGRFNQPVSATCTREDTAIDLFNDHYYC